MTRISGIHNHLFLVNIGTTLSGGIDNFGYTLQINYLHLQVNMKRKMFNSIGCMKGICLLGKCVATA
jgi:hypothetical protein